MICWNGSHFWFGRVWAITILYQIVVVWVVMPSGQMVSIEVWSNPNWIQQWDKHPADEKGVRSEIGSETWSSGRIEVSVVFCVLVCLRFLCGF